LNALDGTGEIFLNLYSPEPSPLHLIETEPLGPGEGTLHEMLPGLDIAPRFERAARLPHAVEILLSSVAFHRSACLVLRALLF
jgi:hypothetical protein